MMFLEYLVILTFLILLAASIYMLFSFYICDAHQCSIFKDASLEGSTDSEAYNLSLIDNLFCDGYWNIAYIACSILTALSLWLIEAPYTTRNFAIIFLISFLCVFGIIGFVVHHYVRPISIQLHNFVEDKVCPDVCIIKN